MRRRCFLGALVGGLVLGFTGAPGVAAAEEGPEQAWIVTVAPSSDAVEIADDATAGDSPTTIGPDTAVVEATPAEVAALRADPDVTSVVPDGLVHTAADPNDPCYFGPGCPVGSSQAPLRSIGSSLAWDVVTGGAVSIAVIDTGVDITRPDLVGRVTLVTQATCPGLLPGTGADDAGNSHGTAVAGVIGAAGNNGLATAGTVPGAVSLRSYKVLNSNGDGALSAVIAGIHCSIDSGVDVINLSLVTTTDSPPLAAAIARAVASDVVVVAAAGNAGSSLRTYPAAYPGVLAVASTSIAGTRSPFSNWGGWISLAAPGEGILSTARITGSTPTGIGSLSGTSLATPFVAGAAALIVARSPGVTAAQVRERILATVEPLSDPNLGAGLLDLSSAVRYAIAGSPACSDLTMPGYRLDGWGGIQPVGGAGVLSGGPYWYGWDIARDLGTAPGLAGGYVLDGWGGVHPATGGGVTPPVVTGGTYWYGWDIARAVARRPDGQGVYVLDGLGGVHLLPAVGASPTMGPGGPYWPTWDIARDVVADPTDSSRGFVLDGFGGVHPFGFATPVEVTGYTGGHDLSRRLVVLPSGNQGYVLDVFGRLHPFAAGGAPLPPPVATASFGFGPLRGVDVRNGAMATTSGWGAVVPTGSTPCFGTNGFGTWDIVRSFAAAP